MLVVSHDLDFLRRLTSTQWALKQGRIHTNGHA